MFAKAQSYWTRETAKNDLLSLGHDVERPLFKGADCKVWVRGVNADGSMYYSNEPFRCQDNAFQMFRKLLVDDTERATGQPASPN